ncbi:hypothetical protein JZ751_006105 [Albula glossodonta]|uniref:FERM domain-containing protein n=1 Tax=Albula glossodonta TaxID=121402 RepID=A0A8T2PCF1_9TELE|nr:hypothetical protein JZ751_006105 [Albula glossodonta]
MEEHERSRSPSRRARRVEQVVGRWLRRSRDSISRERKSADGRSGGLGGSSQHNFPVRVTVQILHDSLLESHGFTISDQHPLLVKDVSAESDDEYPMGAPACAAGPKSSFMTAEKRARLRSNPVKVRFAEEVVVNGHAQGNSLLFLPNVLKVYLENGQTKAFKFEATTTVKEILLTLKEKLSIRCIGHFALVVQRKDSHDYRCLFRVSFLPRDPLDLFHNDPVAFEYLYLQSVSDVLRERFAVEMKCNTALCLAALHMQERLHSCGQTHRTSVKSITKDWGIENFISPTLLRNMREKDLRKAISYHMKKTQSLLEPRQKVLSVAQARLNYLLQLWDLMSYGGKFFTATMMDRESMVNLLVGARYGISQVVNHKLNLLSPLIDFNSISRVELMPDSEKVSVIKIYLQDMKPVTLLMESVAAKDLSCLVSGYCKLQADPEQSIFPLAGNPKGQRISAEEGYESRVCSDSDESTEEDAASDILEDMELPADDTEVVTETSVERPKNEQEEGNGAEEEVEGKETPAEAADDCVEARGGVNEMRTKVQVDEDLFLELSDWCHTDSRVDASFSSDSMDAMMEDDIVPRSLGKPSNPEVDHPTPVELPALPEPKTEAAAPRPANIDYDKDPSLCFAELSRMADCLPSPPEASEEEEEQLGSGLPPQRDHLLAYRGINPLNRYNVCSNTTPSSARGPAKTPPGHVQRVKGQAPPQGSNSVSVPQPPSVHGDSSSEDEFFDAPDRFTPPVPADEVTSEACMDGGIMVVTQRASEGEMEDKRSGERREGRRNTELVPSVKKCHKRRSFIETDLTTQVSFPGQELQTDREERTHNSESHLCPTAPTLSRSEGEPTPVDSKPIQSLHSHSVGSCDGGSPRKAKQLTPDLSGVEPSIAGDKEVKTVIRKPPVASPSLPNSRQQVETESRETSGGEGENNRDKNSLPPLMEGSASSRHKLGNQGQSDGCVTEKMGSMTNAPITKQQAAEKQEGSPGQLSPSRSRWAEKTRGGISTAPTVPPRPRSWLTPPSSMPSTPWPGKKQQSNKEPEPQPAPPIFRLENRKRNSCFALLLKNGISLSYENLLRFEMESLGAANTNSNASGNAGSNNVSGNTSGDTSTKANVNTGGNTGCSAIAGVNVSPKEPKSLDLQGCPSTLGGRLSSSTLRGKIQKLPWYLSQPQEPQGSQGNSSQDENRGSSGLSETSQSTTEVREVLEGDAKIAQLAADANSCPDAQAHLGPDDLLITSSCKEKEDTVSPYVGLKSETQGHTDSSFDRQGPISHLGKEKGPHIASDCSHLLRTADNRLPKRAGGSFGQCESKQPQPCPSGNTGPGCGSSTGLVQNQAHREACGCRTVYTNCFSGALDGSGFDEDLTVHEFSRRTQGLEGTPLTSPLPSSFSSPSFPSFSLSPLTHSVTSELSPLLPPSQTPNGFPATPPEDALIQLRTRRYRLPGGFTSLQRDVEELLMLLQGVPCDQGQQQDQSQDMCETLLSKCEGGRLLHAEARKLMSGCQQVTRVGQTPDEMLQCLADSFRALVRLACSCLRSSGGDGRQAKTLGALREIAGAYGEFARAAERAKTWELRRPRVRETAFLQDPTTSRLSAD